MERKEIFGLLWVFSFLAILPAKNLSNVSKISFYTFFFSSICILFLYFRVRQTPELAGFHFGVIVIFVVLCLFKAIPFIEGWTRHGSLLQEIFGTPFPVHHSFLAILFSPFVALVFALRNRLPARLRFWIYALIGADLFSFISQVPEIILYGTLFWY